MNIAVAPFETVFVRRKFVSRKPVDGQARTSMPEYRIWTGMIARCSNPKTKAYRRYGGRGIDVCARWRQDFANFYADIGPRPTPNHSVDRIDNDGNYEPGNCRWATPREQYLNRGDSHVMWTANDYETLKKMYLGYYSYEEMAAALNRTVATVRLHIHHEKLHREASVTKLANKNPDLRHLLQTGDKEAFLQAVVSRTAGRQERSVAQRQQNLQEIADRAKIILRTDESRNSKMRAMREAGMNLTEIGKHFSITRERVRQLEAAGFPDEKMAAGSRRKISKTNPVTLRKRIDRLCRAWNAASREARVEFVRAAPNHFFSAITVDDVVAGGGIDPATYAVSVNPALAGGQQP